MNLELQTKKELDLLVRDIKRLGTAFRLFSVVVYVLFCIYKIVINTGTFALNIVLLCVSVVYLGFVIFFTVNEAQSRAGKRIVLVSDKVYHYVKLAALVFSAVLAVVGIATAKDHVTVISVLLAVFLPVCVVLQLVLDLALYYFTKRVERFQTALTQDMETLKRDMVKIAIELVKESIFPKKESKGKRENGLSAGSADDDEEENGLIVVGSDELKSVRSLKKIEDGGRKKGGFFNFFRRGKGRKQKSESKAEIALSSDGEKTDDGKNKE